LDIRKKSVLVTAVIFLVLLLITISVFMISYGGNLLSVQKNIAVLEAEKATNEVRIHLERLKALSYDLGTWDETVAFLNGEKLDFSEQYINDEYIDRMSLDMLAITDIDGNIKLLNYNSKKQSLEEVAYTKIVRSMITNNYLIQEIKSKKAVDKSEIYFLKSGVLEINARSVTDNLGELEPQGLIFTADFIFEKTSGWGDGYKISNILSGYDITKYRKIDGTYYRFVNDGDLKFILPSSLFKGREVLIEKTYPELIDSKKQLLINLVIVFVLAMLGAVGSIYVFRRFIMNPLNVLREFMGNLNLENIEQRRIEINSNDEFFQLANYINGAIDRIEKDSKTIKNLNARHEQAMEAAGAGSFGIALSTMHIRMDKKMASLIGYSGENLEIPIENIRELFDVSSVNNFITKATYEGVAILEDDIILPTVSEAGSKTILFKADLNRLREDDDLYDITGIAFDYTEEFLKEKQLEFISFHDILTGLYNRSYFESVIDELEEKNEMPYGIVIGDMNGLKMVNDTFGHEEGDKLLKTIAVILRESSRKKDLVFRWGGDEFCIVLPGANEEVMKEIINSTMYRLENYSGSIIPPSISLGHIIRDAGFNSAAEAIREAEEMMYSQKVSQSKVLRENLLQYFRDRLEKNGIETLQHNKRLLELAERAGIAAEFSDAKIDELKDLATLHDIGMISVSENIVLKQEDLDDYEWDALKLHTETGFRICKATPEFSHIAYALLSHHERFDGLGYPRGIKNGELPMISRIFSVLDSFVSMTSDRPYRNAISEEEAIREIESKAGTQFDPVAVKICLKIF